MSATVVHTIGGIVRRYGVALAFALGQIGPFPGTPPRQPLAIVRLRADDRDAMGYDPRERLPKGGVMTVPLPHRQIEDPGLTHHQPEPAWLRNN